MKSLLLAGAALQRVLEGRDWQFCFIGGVANFRWGTPRLTNDLDLTLLAGFGNETAYAEALLTEFEGRVPDALEELVFLKEEPELLAELERIAVRAEQVIGPFPRPR